MKPPPPPPPPPEIIVEATDWPHFLRHPVDPGERARRAQQAADELRERKFRLARQQQTIPGRTKKSENGRRKVDIVLKVVETMVSPGTLKRKAWGVAGDALKQINKNLKLERFDEMTQRKIYDAIRVQRIWSNLTSLRKR
jgi:hypothetical protein